MGFLDKIEEQEKGFFQMLREEAGKLPLYIWGAGQGGMQMAMLLENEGIFYDGIAINRKYYQEGQGVLCLEDLLEAEDSINIIIAFKGYKKELLAGYEDRIANVMECDCWAGINLPEESKYISWSWLTEHEGDLEAVYDMLQDDLSRRSFLAFIHQKLSMKFGYLSEVKVPFQYFDQELVKLSDTEVFVDCGAYVGDTAVAFIEALKRRGISTWKEIISFEPDPENYEEMKKLGLENHRCIRKGVADSPGILYFSSNDVSGRIEESGDLEIEVDTIDHVVGQGDVTMIKMDIEGAELSALQGAKEAIKRCHPVLAVCLYHKNEDLYEIPQYIKSLVPEYQFYIRAYEEIAVELVLYGIYNG